MDNYGLEFDDLDTYDTADWVFRPEPPGSRTATLLRAPIRQSSIPDDTLGQQRQLPRAPIRQSSTQDETRHKTLSERFERQSPYSRSFSHPPERPYGPLTMDLNSAIHDEIMSNPWGTTERRPRKRNRYAVYFPDNGPFHQTYGQYYDNKSYETSVTPRSREKGRTEFSDNIYATYRRAPRTLPILDVINDFQKPDDKFIATNNKRQLVEGHFDNVLPKLSNVEANTLERNVGFVDQTHRINARVQYEADDTRPNVKHLFSIKLNDVKQMNASDNDEVGEDDRELTCDKIKHSLCGAVSLRRKRRTSDKDTNNKTLDAAAEKMKVPFFYCKWVAEYPKTLFLITLGGHILIALVTAILLFSGYDLFPTDFETLPMYDWSVPWLKRDFAWRFRNEYQQRYVRKWYLQGINKWYRSMAYDRANIVLYYDTGGDGNIFTKKNFKDIERIENKLLQMHNYTDYCVQTSALKCQPFNSVLRYFDGTFAHINPVFNDTDYNDIAHVLYEARTNNETKADFAYFLSSNHHVTKTHAYAPVTRTIVPMGYPLALEQKLEAMEEEMERFLVKNFKPAVHDVKDRSHGFEVIYWSYLLFRHDIVIQIFFDLILAVGSVSFIYGFIVYHTKSLWISTFAVSSILTSFLCTNIIYRVVLDFRYFGFFHVITLFIILGIGADDLFVFLDVWKNTGYQEFPSLAHRLSSAYKKSIKSMFFTSLTTTVAFLANGFSPLLATKSFGIFAALLVVVNYLSVMIYFPCVVIIHHIYFKHWQWPCFSFISSKLIPERLKPQRSEKPIKKPLDVLPNNEKLFEDNYTIGTDGNRYTVVGTINPSYKTEDDEYGFIPVTVTLTGNHSNYGHGHSESSCDTDYTSSNGHARPEGSSFDSGETSATSSFPSKTHVKQKKLLVRFFRDYYFQAVTHWVIKWIIVIILMALVVFFAFCISKLETDNEQPQFYRKSHNYGAALDLDFHGFVANKNDRNVVVYIVWGLEERDMSSCHFSDGRCIGTERFDESFNPNTLEAQLALRNFCDKLHTFTNEEIDHYKIRRDFTSGHPEIKCFARDLDRFLYLESDASGENMTLPWTYRKAISFMQGRSLIYNTFKFNSSFPNVFEIPISYWLNDKYRFENKENFDDFHYLIGEGISPYSSPMKSDFSVFYGNRLVYLGVQVNLTLGRFSTGYTEGKPAMDRWESFVNDQVSKMPPGMQKGFQLTKDYWHSLSVQQTIADNAIFGILTGIFLAFPILTIATQNVLIGVFATLCMCCSTVCVIGIIPLIGWKLGVLESLNMCMVVGLTVDYVVHLAEGYHLSKRADRKSRVQDMLEVMGISVFSGACTTLGASVFMFFAQIQFIIRFGIFMFCTIGFSLLFSLGLFSTVMGIFGPNGETGDIKVIYRKLVEQCKRVF